MKEIFEENEEMIDELLSCYGKTYLIKFSPKLEINLDTSGCDNFVIMDYQNICFRIGDPEKIGSNEECLFSYAKAKNMGFVENENFVLVEVS